jgi:DNA-binding CsgD family transcriptional regulator
MHARAGLDPVAVADLMTAPAEAVAEQAQKALWPVLPHTALVLVTPGSPNVPVQIAAPGSLQPRLADVDWMELVTPQLPEENGVVRLQLPGELGALQVAGWAAKTGDVTVALIVGESRRLRVTPAQEHGAKLTAMCVAGRARPIEPDPVAGMLTFSRALNQERERIRLEARSRHATTLSSLLHSVRASAGPAGASGLPPGMARAIDMASQALVALQTEPDVVDPVGPVPVAAVFAELADELRPALRPAGIELASTLDADDDALAPHAVAHGARLFSRVAALLAMERAGTDRLRLRWWRTDEALTVIVADNGMVGDDRTLAHIRRVGTEVHGQVDVDSHPGWGTTVTATFALPGPAPVRENPPVGALAELHDREQEVLSLMVAGLRNRDIAARLFIGERTVKFHVSNVLAKLRVDSRLEAMALAHTAALSKVPAAFAA